ncbi:hypothetical protein FisN_10Lu423 [Fistulifera solaris]|uniref:Uncharacterized protein n=1 Tax=Fistulifera solaris TaxID=1519565 RepID=A0A1Z5JUH8_FISSO|nr:hypothetical protein FisN_10Lu423 [Fistulifera solaris]|eukprot:GAX17704.1 hypothetical protein FisN_10Lu423 [Fistulifera solaris]
MQPESHKNDPILQLVPLDNLSTLQMAFRLDVFGQFTPIFQFVREPTRLDAIDWEKYPKMAIWRENGTLISIGDDESFTNRKKLSFTLEKVGKHSLLCEIYGNFDDAAMAETAAWFWSLQHPEGGSLFINHAGREMQPHCVFDYSILQPEQLARILDSNPMRHLHLQTGNGLQNNPLCSHRDHKGTAFVDALKQRDSRFGSLRINCAPDMMPFSRDDLQQLLQLENVFEKLTLNSVEEDLVLLPLSAKVRVLKYDLDGYGIRGADLDSIDIAARDLDLRFDFQCNYNWVEVLTSFFNRVASLGHFEKLRLSVGHSVDSICFEQTIPIVQALKRAVGSNPKLMCLDLSDIQFLFDWPEHFAEIFQSLEVHNELRTLVLSSYPPTYYDEEPDYQAYYSILERLLFRNRNITVVNESGKVCSNGTSIDRLYAMHRFYHGSRSRVKEEPSLLRPLLVTTALRESASNNLQLTCVLLSHNVDILCELVDNADFEQIAGPQSTVMDVASVPTLDDGEICSKRKSELHPSHAAKKALT